MSKNVNRKFPVKQNRKWQYFECNGPLVKRKTIKT